MGKSKGPFYLVFVYRNLMNYKLDVFIANKLGNFRLSLGESSNLSLDHLTVAFL